MRNVLKVLVITLIFGMLLVGTATAKPQSELTGTFTWPEAGLTFPYPADWSLFNDPDFDFLLVEPTQNSSFIALQSGSFAEETETLEDMMRLIAGPDADTLTETTLGDVEAWRLDFSDGTGETIVMGFSPSERRISIFILVTDSSDSWGDIFKEVLEGATVTPLELDSELLNSQMQASFEADGSLTVGDPDAPALVVEFMDFSCSHCANFSHSIDRLVQDYVMTGEARLTLTVLTFVGGPYSETAGVAQYCAAEMGFGWDMHGLLFSEYEAKGAQTAYTRDNILAAVEASEWEIDSEAFATCLSQSKAEYFEANSALADEMGVQGTPTTFWGTSMDDLGLLPTRSLIAIYALLDVTIESQ